MENEMQTVARYLGAAPVDLYAIFDALGIDYAEKPIGSGESAWIERKGDRFSVVVNASEGATRRRFSAAHELAHYLLHRDLMQIDGDRMNRHTDRLYGVPEDNPASPFTRQHEIQANRLAAQIVMPAPLVRKKFAEYQNAGQLAAAFGVSKAAMEIRLKTLGLAA
ncbi:Zn-dependent peptidase ImmA (M78 family) [Sphingopyxis panaciterrae]|uniref:ImmA/IrrE family metallo-endopeptidase n=1 Tax=Sphingopyxis panaciterrae TaxID=363841 RepID=UPI0014225253|nr:ImmA/IrrE family metallo-endopeptidase [Sphingopyxis panaciterrae]NIJ39328.1 Zn-dependent peptidase ImmA (M78 family) [Sphingopyxis panaciterrae]